MNFHAITFDSNENQTQTNVIHVKRTSTQIQTDTPLPYKCSMGNIDFVAISKTMETMF